MGNRVSAGAVRGEIRKGLVVAGGCLGVCGSECGGAVWGMWARDAQECVVGSVGKGWGMQQE